MRNDSYLHFEITGAIIKAYYEVYNILGYGFLEKNYENALKAELEEMGLKVVQQEKVNVFYKGESIGDYFYGFSRGGCSNC